MNLSLVYQALTMLMKILNRVLNSNDMLLTLPVDHIDNCCQGRGFPASGGSGYEYQTSRFSRQLNDYIRKSELLK